MVSVYGSDLFGNDVVRGYGATHIPFTAGQSVLPHPLFLKEDLQLLKARWLKIHTWIHNRGLDLFLTENTKL